MASPSMHKRKRAETAPPRAWQKPPPGWFKLNTKPLLKTSTWEVAVGGLVRDDEGNFVTGFSRKQKGVSVNAAELVALREGLSVAWERRLRRIVVEINSEAVFNLLKAEDTTGHPLQYLLEECRRYSRLPWDFAFQRNKREGNACAEFLAKAGFDVEGLHVWEEPPFCLLEILSGDSSSSSDRPLVIRD